MYSINFTLTKKKFCLRLHCNGENSYLFVNGTEVYIFVAYDPIAFNDIKDIHKYLMEKNDIV